MPTETPHTWTSVLAQLEFDVAELRYEHTRRNPYQPEAVKQAERLLHRATVAFWLDVPLAAWLSAEAR